MRDRAPPLVRYRKKKQSPWQREMEWEGIPGMVKGRLELVRGRLEHQMQLNMVAERG